MKKPNCSICGKPASRIYTWSNSDFGIPAYNLYSCFRHMPDTITKLSGMNAKGLLVYSVDEVMKTVKKPK